MASNECLYTASKNRSATLTVTIVDVDEDSVANLPDSVESPLAGGVVCLLVNVAHDLQPAFVGPSLLVTEPYPSFSGSSSLETLCWA